MSHGRIFTLALLLALLVAAFGIYSAAFAAPPAQVANCTEITGPTQIPSPGLINFDNLPNAAVIGASYQPLYGVRFENSAANRAIIYGNEPAKAH